MSDRFLIVNADDFGLSPGVNAGIIRSFKHGIVTSASLMVRWPAAQAAADYARQHARLSLGLHIDLVEWVCRDYEWSILYQVVSTQDSVAVRAEVRRQLDLFRKLVGEDPTHLDSHQHVHREEPVRSALLEVSKECGVPLRSCVPDIPYCGDFYGQTGEGFPYPEGITKENLACTLKKLPPGFTEMACHPGDDPHLNSVYCCERIQEMMVLCDPEIRRAVDSEGIRLCSFSDYLNLKGGRR